MSESAQKRLRLVTYGLFAVLVGFWTTVLGTSYVALAPWVPAGQSPWGYVLSASWLLMVIILVLCVAVYVGYRYWYLPGHDNPGK